MPSSSSFSLNVLKKLETVFDLFQNDPNQNLEKLCDKFKLPKSTLYSFCRQNKIIMAEIREGKDLREHIDQILKINKERKGELATNNEMPDIKYTGRGGVRTEPIPTDTMEAVIAKVDEFRKQGINVEEAMKKAKINLHFSTYYTYKRKLGKIEKEKLKKSEIKPEIKNEIFDVPNIEIKKPKPKRAYNTSPKKDVPTVPHTIEYIEKKKPKSKQEIIMMIGNAEALIDFLRMKGKDDDN